MASQEDLGGEGRTRRKRHTRRKSRPSSEHDWAAIKVPERNSPPHPSGRDNREEEETSPLSTAKERKTSQRHRRSTQASTSSSSTGTERPKSAMAPMTKTADGVPYRRPGREQSWEDDERYARQEAGRRREARRELSPRSTVRHRSTPDTRQSSVSCDSSSDSETEATQRSEDEREHRERRRRPYASQAPTIADARRDSTRENRDRKDKSGRTDKTQSKPKEGVWMSGAQAAPSSTVDGTPERRHVGRHHHHHRRRTASVDTSASRTTSKQSSKRDHESGRVDKPRPMRRLHTTPASSARTSSQSVTSSRRSSSFLGSLLPGGFRSKSPPRSLKPVKLVECVICMDEEIPSDKAADLKCGHKMCHKCLKRSFRLSLTDPQHMPPTCCNADHIPLKHVSNLFDNGFKKTWNKKYAEFSTRNRIYCPSSKCGEWIQPENIHRDNATGRKYGKCAACRTKVCAACNGKWHSSSHCPKDDETKKFLEQAKKEGWQRCHKCKAMVELKEGCNHMTCRCGAEFCMICAKKWKTCDCPWFNYETVENDRLQHMQVPQPLRPRLVDDIPPPVPGQGIRYRQPQAFVPNQGAPPDAAPFAARPRPHTFEEERMLRQLQEQRDEDLARRLQAQDLDNSFAEPFGIRGGGSAGGLRARTGLPSSNPLAPLRPDEYRRPTGANVNYSPTAASALRGEGEGLQRANSGTGTGYISGLSRERSVRDSSQERRLADRFKATSRQSTTDSSGSARGGGGLAYRPLRPAVAPLSGSPGQAIPMHMPMPMPMMPQMGMPVPVPNPMAAAPPLAMPPMLRRFTMESDAYEPATRTAADPSEVRRTRSHSHRSKSSSHNGAPEHKKEPRMSMLAGLTGPGRGMGRVREWSHHVEPGVPEADTVA